MGYYPSMMEEILKGLGFRDVGAMDYVAFVHPGETFRVEATK